jgi:hypothetical protein
MTSFMNPKFSVCHKLEPGMIYPNNSRLMVCRESFSMVKYDPSLHYPHSLGLYRCLKAPEIVKHDRKRIGHVLFFEKQ